MEKKPYITLDDPGDQTHDAQEIMYRQMLEYTKYVQLIMRLYAEEEVPVEIVTQ